MRATDQQPFAHAGGHHGIPGWRRDRRVAGRDRRPPCELRRLSGSRGRTAPHLRSRARLERAPGSGLNAGTGPTGWSFRHNRRHAPPGALDARRTAGGGSTSARRFDQPATARRALSKGRRCDHSVGPGGQCDARAGSSGPSEGSGQRDGGPQSNLHARPLPRPPMCHRSRVRRRSSGLRGCRSSSRTSVRCVHRSKRWSRRQTGFSIT